MTIQEVIEYLEEENEFQKYRMEQLNPQKDSELYTWRGCRIYSNYLVIDLLKQVKP